MQPEEWDTDPFKAVIKRGKLYGRGACDAKGPFAAAVAGLDKQLPADPELGQGDIAVLSFEACQRVSEENGLQELNENLELPRQEGRVLKGMALAHATSNRGADHLYALPTPDLTGNMEVVSKVESLAQCGPELMDTTSEKYIAHMVRFTETCNALADALGICKFAFTETYAILPSNLAEGLRALGFEISADELFRAGQRIVTLERMYNVRHGFDRKDDTLPKRILLEPLDVYVDPGDIEQVPPEEAEMVHRGLKVDLDPMLDDYYALGRWDSNGVPLPERLEELGLNECIPDLP